MEISFRSHPNYNELIAIRFGTWHNSCVVVACAKFCSIMTPNNGVTVIKIFNQILIMMERSFVTWPPNKLVSFTNVIFKCNVFNENCDILLQISLFEMLKIRINFYLPSLIYDHFMHLFDKEYINEYCLYFRKLMKSFPGIRILWHLMIQKTNQLEFQIRYLFWVLPRRVGNSLNNENWRQETLSLFEWKYLKYWLLREKDYIFYWEYNFVKYIV